MARIYIACPWKHKGTAKITKELLESKGITVTSRWMDFQEILGTGYEYPEGTMRQEALNDIEDIVGSDGMLYLNLEKSEGKATELGMALILGLPIWVVGGKANNVFLHLPQINHLGSVEEFVEMAEATHAGTR